MLTKFWEKTGEAVASEWSLRLITPAFAFWASGLLAWATRNGWKPVEDFFNNTSFVTAGALLIAGAFLLAISSGIVQWITFSLLRWFEGYWPGFLQPLRTWRIRQINDALLKKEQEWEHKKDLFDNHQLNAQGQQDFLRLDADLDIYPADVNNRMPTKFGNLLRSSEEYPHRRYGLEIKTTWPRLWLELPEITRQELGNTRESINWTIQLIAWALLFVIWAVVFWVWWPVLVTLVVTFAAYQRMIFLADVYGQVIRSAYDLHRFSLYEAMRWPLPNDPYTEEQYGKQFTVFLKQGLAPNKLACSDQKVAYQHIKKS